MKFSPEKLDGENNLMRDSLLFILFISIETLEPFADAETSPGYPLARVSTWRKTGHERKTQTGVAKPVDFDRLSLKMMDFPISFRNESTKGQTSYYLF